MANDLINFVTEQSLPTPTPVGVELAEKILKRTIEGKIHWSRIPSGHRGSTPDGTLVIQLDSNPASVFGPMWSSFKVFRAGEEIFKAENSVNGLLMLSGLSDPLSARVSKLFEYLQSARDRQVEAALTELDNL